MGRPRKWKSDAERKRAERAGSSEPLPTPESQESQEEAPQDGTHEIVQIEALELALRARGPELPPREVYDALGRRYGEDTAERLGETGQKRKDRITRAIAYQRFLQAEGKPPT